MADYSDLKAAIRAAIYDNVEQAITGDVLQDTLIDMVDELGQSYVKPATGIPATDLAEGVQQQLTEAGTAVQPEELATVATTGDYDDLTNKPAIPAEQVNADWDATTGKAEILNKPTIPTALADLSEDATHRVVTDAEKADWSAKYDKPADGIPATDMTSAVQSSLAKADTALQTHQDISGKADKVSGATSGDFAALDANGNLADSGKKASDFATAAQGGKADTAIQPATGISIAYVWTGTQAQYEALTPSTDTLYFIKES